MEREAGGRPAGCEWRNKGLVTDFRTWKHVFKLDPDREISDETLERVCLSGTHAVLLGGSTGVTYDNTVELMARIRRFEVPCVLEVSHPEAIVPGFDVYLIPVVLNAGNPQWITGHHHTAIREWGSVMPWEQIIAEGYIILNPDSAAAALTGALAPVTAQDAEAYARMADKLFRTPVVYMEYSGTFGDMDTVRRARSALTGARLFYGGGIDSLEKARLALDAADTIVVGNALYDRLEQALETVHVLREERLKR